MQNQKLSQLEIKNTLFYEKYNYTCICIFEKKSSVSVWFICFLKKNYICEFGSFFNGILRNISMNVLAKKKKKNPQIVNFKHVILWDFSDDLEAKKNKKSWRTLHFTEHRI